MLSPAETQKNSLPKSFPNSILWIWALILVYLLIAAVSTIGFGFKIATAEKAEQLFEFATNPLLGLVVGILATSLVQSSSTVTSIIVGLVAGGLPISIAIPMVMGANLGTSVTNTLVSFGHIRDLQEFKRAFAAATVLDFFNLLAVLLLFPIEIFFHPLETFSHAAAEWLLKESSAGIGKFNLISFLVYPVVFTVVGMASLLPGVLNGVAVISCGIGLIILSISMLGKTLRRLMVGRALEILKVMIGRGPLSGIFSGTVVTVMVQSSSTTTSLIVPLAGAGIVDMRQVYPFTLGANIGTCITALLASTAFSGSESIPALEIALIHLVFNVLGVSVIYAIPFLRNIPPAAAKRLAEIASRKRAMAFTYVGGVFFAIPGCLLAVSWLMS